MANATVVGKVAIRVIPDTKGFRQEAKKKLEKATYGVKAKVGITLDDDDVRQEALRVRNKIEDELEKVPASIVLDMREEKALAEIARVDAALDQLGRVDLRVDLNEQELIAARQLLAQLDDEVFGDIQTRVAEAFHDVNVSPDLDDEAVRRLDRDIEAFVSKQRELAIKLEVDGLSAREERDLKRQIADIDRAIEATFTKVDARRFDFRELRDLVAEEFDKIVLDPEVDSLALRKADREIQSLLQRRREIRVDLEDGGEHLGKQVKQALVDELDDIALKVRERLDSVDLDVRLRLEAESVAKAEAEIAAATRDRAVKVRMDVENRSLAATGTALSALAGTRAVGSMWRDFGRALSNIDIAAPKIVAVTTALFALTAAAGSGVSNILALSGSLASIFPAALALPGILGGFAVGLTTTVVALRDFNSELPNVAPRITELGDAMSDSFWERARAPMQRMIDRLLPQLRQGFVGASDAVGGFFAAFSDSIVEKFDGQFRAMFDNFNRSVDIASRYTDDYAGSIATLGRVGSSYLPRLAEWFGEAADSFDRWLTRAERTGELQGWIDTGIDALSDLGRVALNAGGFLGGLSRAATKAGGTNLDSLANGLERINRAVNSTRGQNRLTNLFITARTAMDNLRTEAGPGFTRFIDGLEKTLHIALPQAGEVAGKAIDQLGRALSRPSLRNGLSELLDSAEKVVDELGPSLGPAVDTLSILADVAGNLAENIARLVGRAAGSSVAFQDVLNAANPLIDSLGDLAYEILVDLESVFEGFAGGVELAVKALDGAVDVVRIVVDLFGLLPDPVSDALGNLVGLGLAVGAATWLGTAVRAKVTAMGTALLQVATGGNAAAVGAARAGGASRTAALLAGGAGRQFAIVAGAMLAMDGAGRKGAGGMAELAGAGAIVGGALRGLRGGVLGGIAGAVYGLGQAFEVAEPSLNRFAPTAENVAATLDKVSGAATEATSNLVAMSLQESGVLDTVRQIRGEVNGFNVSLRDMTAATLGNEGANERLQAAIRLAYDELERLPKGSEAYERLKDQITELSGVLGETKGSFLDAGASAREAYLATAPLSRILRGFPKEVRTLVRQEGVPKTIGEILRLKDQYNLTPKQVQTLVRLNGTVKTEADLQRIVDKYNLTPKEITTLVGATELPNSKNLRDGLIAYVRNLDRTKGNAQVGVKGIDVARRIVRSFKNDVESVNKRRVTAKVGVDARNARRETNQLVAQIVRQVAAARPVFKMDANPNPLNGKLRNGRDALRDFGNIVAKPNAELDDKATSKINAVKTRLTDLNGRKATVTIEERTVRVTEFRTQGSPPPTGSTPLTNDRRGFSTQSAPESNSGNTINYYAAPTAKSVSSEEELFMALQRSRSLF